MSESTKPPPYVRAPAAPDCSRFTDAVALVEAVMPLRVPEPAECAASLHETVRERGQR